MQKYIEKKKRLGLEMYAHHIDTMRICLSMHIYGRLKRDWDKTIRKICQIQKRREANKVCGVCVCVRALSGV